MGHEVRTHTRTTANGRTVTVRRHTADDPGDGGLSLAQQRKRDRLERRVVTERQQGRIKERFGVEPGKRKPRTTKTRGPSPKGARKRARQAVRKMRRHKVQGVLMLSLAAGELGLWAAGRGSRKAYRTGRKAWKATAGRVRKARAGRAKRKAART
jgi:hypothetical protein